MSTEHDFLQAIKASTKEKTKSYDTTATVVAIEHGIAYVHIPGGVERTPAEMAISAKVGDMVKVRVSGGRAYTTGNVSSPPTDDTIANQASAEASAANQTADAANLAARAAIQSAEVAKESADSALKDALEAREAAEQAVSDATTAKEASSSALEDAKSAKSSAEEATQNAENAITEAEKATTAAEAATQSAGEAKASAASAEEQAVEATLSANSAGRAAANAQAAAEAAQGEIDEQKGYFWHDELGAHVLSEEDGYRTDVLSNGVKITSAEDSRELASFTTDGVLFDNTIPVTIGNDQSYMKFFDSDGDGKADAIKMSGTSLLFTTGESAEEVITQIKQDTETVKEALDSGELKGEDAVLLRIDSTRGTVFKNNAIATVLTVTIYQGAEKITDIASLRAAFGSGAYLQWSWQKMDEETFGVISAGDSMLSHDGFHLNISAEEVDTKVTFSCDLII